MYHRCSSFFSLAAAASRRRQCSITPPSAFMSRRSHKEIKWPMPHERVFSSLSRLPSFKLLLLLPSFSLKRAHSASLFLSLLEPAPIPPPFHLSLLSFLYMGRCFSSFFLVPHFPYLSMASLPILVLRRHLPLLPPPLSFLPLLPLFELSRYCRGFISEPKKKNERDREEDGKM